MKYDDFLQKKCKVSYFFRKSACHRASERMTAFSDLRCQLLPQKTNYHPNLFRSFAENLQNGHSKGNS